MGEIGKNIKRLRKKKGLSIRALAKSINISHNTLVFYEREELMPSLKNSFKLATFFNVPIEYLIIGEKTISDFYDVNLLVLFKEVDSMDEENRNIVKNFILKLIKNKKEREKIIDESQ